MLRVADITQDVPPGHGLVRAGSAAATRHQPEGPGRGRPPAARRARCSRWWASPGRASRRWPRSSSGRPQPTSGEIDYEVGRCRRAPRPRAPAGGCRWCSRIPTRRSIPRITSGRCCRSCCCCTGRAARRGPRREHPPAQPRRPAGGRPRRLPEPVLGRPAPAAGHRAGALGAARHADRRRAGLGPRRVGPGDDPRPVQVAAGRARPQHPVRRAQPRRGSAPQPAGRGHVPRPDRRGRRHGRALPQPAAPLHARADRLDPAHDGRQRQRASSSSRASRRARSTCRPAAASTRGAPCAVDACRTEDPGLAAGRPRARQRVPAGRRARRRLPARATN